MNWKCRLGLHAWTYDGQAVIGGYVYEAAPHIEVQVGKRTIYFRKCLRCETSGQYYPTGSELADIIREHQRIEASRVTVGMSENGVG